MEMMTIALSKGRISENACEILKRAGLADSIDLDSRKLVFEDKKNAIRYISVKPSDVVTYVESGVADLGIAGKDTILESRGDVYEIMNLGFGRCKFSVAGIRGANIYEKDQILKVATKYPNVARDYFMEKKQKIEIIKLNGSVELAPLVGLSKVIVDLVETGSTLRANGLEILEDMHEISARLISNRSSYRFNYERINEIAGMIGEGLR